MLFQLLRTERIKLKRSPVWLAFVFMPVIPALLGTMNYLGNLDLLKSQWYSLWTQHTLFTCYFFLPIMLGIYCGHLMGLEHKNQNWNKLLSMPVPIPMIFLAKLITASFMVLLSEAWIGILYVISGKIAGIATPVPVQLLEWLLCGALGAIVMVSIQLFLSLVIKSFALPVGLALIGGISGLVALAKGFGHIWPYSLMAYGMKANAPQKLTENGILPFFLTCAFFLLLFILAGSKALPGRGEA